VDVQRGARGWLRVRKLKWRRLAGPRTLPRLAAHKVPLSANTDRREDGNSGEPTLKVEFTVAVAAYNERDEPRSIAAYEEAMS
jgi:hypothetical protein